MWMITGSALSAPPPARSQPPAKPFSATEVGTEGRGQLSKPSSPPTGKDDNDGMDISG
jgi:hypothetical protein